MKIAVRYYSKTGNTKKLADAIGQALGVQALSVDEPLKDDVDILFLGSSVYGAGVDKKVKDFISSINTNVGEFVNFSTAAIIESTYKQIKKLVENKGLSISEKEFHCRGSFALMHRNRPNAEDLTNAADFAKGYLKQ